MKLDFLERRNFKIENKTNDRADLVLIMLHGLGASGFDFADLPNALSLKSDLKLLAILPHAPSQPITINGGAMMPAWYDIESIEFDRKTDQKSASISVDLILSLIDEQIKKGYQSEQVILGGFSQGGAMAATTAVEFLKRQKEKKLAGVIILSSYLLDSKATCNSTPLKRIPIFMAHGTHDAIVPYQLGRKHAKLLQQEEFNLTWKEYPISHEVSREELADISSWINSHY